MNFWPFRCRHAHLQFPRRQPDGRDWQYCPDCHKRILSTTQFQVPTPVRRPGNVTIEKTGLERMGRLHG